MKGFKIPCHPETCRQPQFVKQTFPLLLPPTEISGMGHHHIWPGKNPLCITLCLLLWELRQWKTSAHLPLAVNTKLSAAELEKENITPRDAVLLGNLFISRLSGIVPKGERCRRQHSIGNQGTRMFQGLVCVGTVYT